MRNYKRNPKNRQDRRPRPIRFDNAGHPITRNTANFAYQAAAQEFGYHRYHAWRQWRDFKDTTPGELARRRAS